MDIFTKIELLIWAGIVSFLTLCFLTAFGYFSYIPIFIGIPIILIGVIGLLVGVTGIICHFSYFDEIFDAAQKTKTTTLAEGRSFISTIYSVFKES